MAKTKKIDLVDINANSVFTPVDVMDNFNKLKVGINDVSTKVDNIELTDTKIDVVAENKKLNVVLKDLKEKINTKSTKGEILPSDIKGNSENKKIIVGIELDDDLDLKVTKIDGVGDKVDNWIFLKNNYMKVADSKKITDALANKNNEQDIEISNLKKNIGANVNLLKIANDTIENNI